MALKNNFIGIDKDPKDTTVVVAMSGGVDSSTVAGIMKKQGYNARKNEQLGMTRGKQSGKKMSMAGRRKVAKATRKPKGSYGFGS